MTPASARRKENRETHVWWDALDHGDQQDIQEQGDRQETRQGRNAHQRSTIGLG